MSIVYLLIMPNMPFCIHFSILELEGILKITVQTSTLQMMTQKVNISEIGKTKTLDLD